MHPANRTALNILVVDDDAAVARALGRLLRSCGHAVQTSHSAREGLELAFRTKPDVILHDLAMRPIDGYAAARRVRQTAALAGTLLVAYSGLVDEEKARQAGFDAWLEKPITAGKLDIVLAMAIERQRAQAGRTGTVK
jgi:CheY-like chemotaxis protein